MSYGAIGDSSRSPSRARTRKVKTKSDKCRTDIEIISMRTGYSYVDVIVLVGSVNHQLNDCVA